MAKPIGTLGTIPTLTVGGRVFTDLTNLLVLGAYNGTGTKYATFRKNNTSAGYFVTSGKTLTISALNVQSQDTSTSTSSVGLGYSTQDVGFNSASEPSADTFQYGNSGFYVWAFIGNQIPVQSERSTIFTIPAASAPFMKSIGSGEVWATVYGYET